MITSLALMLALDAPDPNYLGPIFLDGNAAGAISALGPIRPAHYCDSYHFGYTDAHDTIVFDGPEITLVPHASRLKSNTARPDAQMPSDAPVAALVPGTAPIRSWTYLGHPIFSLPNALPGFVAERKMGGELLHLYRSRGPKLSIFKMTDGNVVFMVGNDGRV